MTYDEVWTGASDGETPIQESDEKKSRWLTWAETAFPPGTAVRVVGGDVGAYIGAMGTVRGYDVGGKGEWPMVSVGFDAPPPNVDPLLFKAADSFYCDSSDAEIERLEPLVEEAAAAIRHAAIRHNPQRTGAVQ